MTAIGDSTSTKICTKCKECKPATAEFFPKRSALKGQLTAHCKACAKAAKESYYQANKEKVKANAIAYYRENTEAVKARVVAYYNANTEKVRERVNGYIERNQEKIKAARSASYQANREAVIERASVYYQANKKKIQATQADWRNRNKWRISSYGKNYAQKIKGDPLLNLQNRYRNIVSKSWRGGGYTKKSRSGEILGCTWEQFKEHIERQFTKGMNWERIGEIHLDHVVPLSSAKTEEDVLALNHYTNLRPLWAKDNLSKGARQTHLI